MVYIVALFLSFSLRSKLVPTSNSNNTNYTYKTARSLVKNYFYEEKLISLLEELLKLVLKREGNYWVWFNKQGTKLQKPYLIEKVLIKKIEETIAKNLPEVKGSKTQDLFEAKVGKEMYNLGKQHNDTGIDFANKVNKGTTGEIDYSSYKYIVEAKTNLDNIDALIYRNNKTTRKRWYYFYRWNRKPKKIILIMSKNQTYISKKYFNKEEVLKSIEKIALKQGFRVEKVNTYIENDIDIIIDPVNEDDDLVYRSSIWVKPKDDFYETKIFHNGQEYYLFIYTSEMYDDNREYKYFNHFIKEFLQLYPDILVDSGSGENFVSIQEILNESERVPSWMLMY